MSLAGGCRSRRASRRAGRARGARTRAATSAASRARYSKRAPVKERHVVCLRLAQVLPEAVNDCQACCIAIGQDFGVKPVAARGYARLEQCVDPINIVNAAVERSHRFFVSVDADEESKDVSRHNFWSLIVEM